MTKRVFMVEKTPIYVHAIATRRDSFEETFRYSAQIPVGWNELLVSPLLLDPLFVPSTRKADVGPIHL